MKQLYELKFTAELDDSHITALRNYFSEIMYREFKITPCSKLQISATIPEVNTVEETGQSAGIYSNEIKVDIKDGIVTVDTNARNKSCDQCIHAEECDRYETLEDAERYVLEKIEEICKLIRDRRANEAKRIEELRQYADYTEYDDDDED